MTDRHRGVSPIVGVILMVVIVLLMASMISYQFSGLSTDLEMKGEQYEDAVTTLSGNPWSGEPGDVFRVSNNKAGATDVRYRVNFTIEPGSKAEGSNLGNAYIEVVTGSPEMFKNVDLDDLVSAGVDTDNDGTIEQDLTDGVEDLTPKNGNTGLHIGLNVTYTQTGGDSIIIVFDDVDNPTTPGDYDLRAETNGDKNWHNGTVTIVA